MQYYRLILLLLVLSSMSQIQLSQASSRQAVNEGSIGYIRYLNNLYHMIDTKYQNEIRVSKLRALQKIIIDVRHRSEALGYTVSHHTLYAMECTVLDEVIEIAGFRYRLRGLADYWINGCDSLPVRYTFYGNTNYG